MSNPYLLLRIFRCLFIFLLINLGGCRTITPPDTQKTQKPAQGSSAAELEDAAKKAFDEMQHPDKPTAYPESTSEKKDKTTASQTPAPKEITGDRLDWLNGTSKSYPATHYLTGVGSGTDRRQAEDDARSEIAKVFISHINTSTKIEQENLKVISAGKNSETNQVNVEDMVQVSTQKTLSGVRIAEIFQQIKPKASYFALAVLDRQQAMTSLKEEVEALDEEIKVLMDQASKETNDLQKLKLLTSAMEKQVLRQTKDAEIRVANPSGKGLAAPIGFEEINRLITDILSQDFKIHVAVSGNRANEIQKKLFEGLTREGFVLTNNADHASVAVKGKVIVKPIDHPDKKWKYVSWQTVFELFDQSNNTVFGTLTDSGREGHLSLEQATNRAVMKIKKELLPKVSKDVRSYIFGQTMKPKK